MEGMSRLTRKGGVRSEGLGWVGQVSRGTEQCRKEVKALTGGLDKTLRDLGKARTYYAK